MTPPNDDLEKKIKAAAEEYFRGKWECDNIDVYNAGARFGVALGREEMLKEINEWLRSYNKGPVVKDMLCLNDHKDWADEIERRFGGNE